MSKIQIWKRITTLGVVVGISVRLYLICQRYKFESESQLSAKFFNSRVAVFNMSKIQIWKRITTHKARFRSCPKAVFNMSKIQIWKRITTWSALARPRWVLYLICQRYKFESESQPEIREAVPYGAVFNMSKIQIWKRITTNVGVSAIVFCCI